ncbi:MAG: protein-L-isoaspartate(D-aspartate) O-methyltransferase [Hyphomonadaceae bacterium]
MEEEAARLMRFVLDLRQAGVRDAKILAAMERTPRAQFAPPHLASLALEDVALPIACGQMMTKPSVIGQMLAALEPRAGDNVLEVGAGSGWQGAVLASLAKKVTTLDRHRPLAADARVRFGALRLMNIEAHGADGRLGWAENAPYDRIIVNAAAPAAPLALLEQLAEGGVLLIPIGEGQNARLLRYRRGAALPEELGAVAFTPLEEGPVQD